MTEYQSGSDKVSAQAAAFVGRAKGWAETLETLEAKRSRVNLEEARPIVARKTGVLPGTLENLRNGRLKAIGTHIYEALRQRVIRELQDEKARLDHEIQIALATGMDPRSGEVASLEADQALVNRALGLGEGTRI